MILTGHISLLQSLQPYAWQGDFIYPQKGSADGDVSRKRGIRCTPCRGDGEAIKRNQQMLLSLAEAQRLCEAGSIASLLGALVIFLVLKLRCG